MTSSRPPRLYVAVLATLAASALANRAECQEPIDRVRVAIWPDTVTRAAFDALQSRPVWVRVESMDGRIRSVRITLPDGVRLAAVMPDSNWAIAWLPGANAGFHARWEPPTDRTAAAECARSGDSLVARSRTRRAAFGGCLSDQPSPFVFDMSLWDPPPWSAEGSSDRLALVRVLAVLSARSGSYDLEFPVTVTFADGTVAEFAPGAGAPSMAFTVEAPRNWTLLIAAAVAVAAGALAVTVWFRGRSL